MKAAGWLKRGVKQLQRRSDQVTAAPVQTAASEWAAPSVAPSPAPEAGLAELHGWLREVTDAAAVVHLQAPETEALRWYAQRLDDVAAHVEYVQHSEPDRFEALQEFAQAVLENPRGKQALQTLQGVHQRVLLWLTAHGRRGDVLNVLADLQDNGRSYPLSLGHPVQGISDLTAAPSYFEMLSEPVDPGLLRLAEVDLPVAARLTRFAWTEEGTLHLSGWAYLPGIDPADCSLEVGLRSGSSSTVAALAVFKGQDPRIDLVAADRWMSYAEAAFTATVDPRLLVDLKPDTGAAAQWALQVTLRFGGMAVSDTIRSRDADTVPRRLPVGPLADERTRVVGLMDRTDGLRLRTVQYSCRTASIEVAGSVVTVGFGGAGGTMPAGLLLDVPGELPTEFQPVQPTGTFTVDMAAVPGFSGAGKDKRWTVTAVLPNGRTEPVGWAGSGQELAVSSNPSAALRAECSGFGYLQMVVRPARVTLDSAEISRDGSALILQGRTVRPVGQPDPGLPQMLLRTARNEVHALSTKWLDDTHRFRTAFPLVQNKWGQQGRALEAGHYRVLCVLSDGPGPARTVRVQALGQLITQLPLVAQRGPASLELVGEGNDEDLVLRISAPRTVVERTALSRSNLVSEYSGYREAVDQQAVLFETFDGKSCSDSGRAISDVLGTQRPDLRRYWTVADYSVPVPPDCTPVLRESREWFRLLATAGYLVNNNNFPHYFRKRPGQFYLQTWHGTPLKRIGMDTPVSGSTASYRALIRRESSAWDMLLAQNDFAADTLAAAFGYRGRPAVLGYPRNDALADESAPLRREKARHRLGITAGQKVLLYMPTWRDGASAINPYLDFQLAATQLGPDYVLLYRGHHKIAGRRQTTGQRVYQDVTAYPEVNDLYLAADLLVTDYSSAMFDFCVTGKPMYFLVPDLKRYRDTERGFYFDFEAQAPGPVVANTDELTGAILSEDAASEPYSLRYKEFVGGYASADDGITAARAVRAVWG